MSLVEQIKDEKDAHAGYSVRLFDELTWSQRIALLDVLATHLLVKPVGDLPQLTAVNEAAVASVFEHVSLQIDREIETGVVCRWRTLVLQAYAEVVPATGNCCSPAPQNSWVAEVIERRSRNEWHTTVQFLADRILWDRDFELMAEFLDEPPEKAAMLRQILGIEENYFAAAADDFGSLADLNETVQRLRHTL